MRLEMIQMPRHWGKTTEVAEASGWALLYSAAGTLWTPARLPARRASNTPKALTMLLAPALPSSLSDADLESDSRRGSLRISVSRGAAERCGTCGWQCMDNPPTDLSLDPVSDAEKPSTAPPTCSNSVFTLGSLEPRLSPRRHRWYCLRYSWSMPSKSGGCSVIEPAVSRDVRRSSKLGPASSTKTMMTNEIRISRQPLSQSSRLPCRRLTPKTPNLPTT
mmetsp:Transcript_50375/g.155752  ORF Transcript_50375/g.155752 Transcript_50375/m.155752 type:complete len:220 (-) Transcript_50375:372-1031(-)